jgi:hypothetical protein
VIFNETIDIFESKSIQIFLNTSLWKENSNSGDIVSFDYFPNLIRGEMYKSKIRVKINDFRIKTDASVISPQNWRFEKVSFLMISSHYSQSYCMIHEEIIWGEQGRIWRDMCLRSQIPGLVVNHLLKMKIIELILVKEFP